MEYGEYAKYAKYALYALIGGALAISFAKQNPTLSAYIIVLGIILIAVIIWDFL